MPVPPVLDDRIAVVTGAAKGIGRAIAEAFGRAGASVMVADLDAAAGRRTVSELRDVGVRAEFHQVDVGRPAEVDGLFVHTAEALGPVSILANMAGVSGRRVGGKLPVLEITEDDFTSLMRVNVLGVLTASQAAARIMKAQGGGGVILNASSGSVDTAGAGMGLYTMSKAAIAMLSKTLATELAPFGIRVNALAPWLTRTAYFDSVFDPSAPESGADAFFDAAAQANPMGRLCTPEDIAALAVFLASDGGSFISGQLLRSNGAALTPW